MARRRAASFSGWLESLVLIIGTRPFVCRYTPLQILDLPELERNLFCNGTFELSRSLPHSQVLETWFMNRRNASRRGELAVVSCVAAIVLTTAVIVSIERQIRDSDSVRGEIVRSTQAVLPVTIRDFRNLPDFKLINQSRDGSRSRHWMFERLPTERIVAEGRSKGQLRQLEFYLDSNSLLDEDSALSLAKRLFSQSDQNEVCDRINHAMMKLVLHAEELQYPLTTRTGQLEFEFNAPGVQPTLIIRAVD